MTVCHGTLESQVAERACEPMPARADLLVVFAHPDDEVSTFDVVASKALRCHRSQSCSTAGVRGYLAYELVRSQVGEDCDRIDFFEGCRGGA